MMAKTFVLVHGAWHGGWCWRRVADLLQAQGHKVFTPTLTGLGERAHLLTPDVNLSTHITDIVNVFKYERLSDVVLCGHSYGGFVISGAVEHVLPAVGSIVYLDAFVPQDGDAVTGLTVASMQDVVRKVVEAGETAIPPRSAAFFGVNEKDRAWVDSLTGPQPLGAFSEKLKLTGALERVAKKAYIRAGSYINPGFDKAQARVKSDPSWRTYAVPCGHDVMVDMPERLAEILVEVA